MRRHELDPLSLVFGFVFAGLGLLFLFGQVDQAVRLRWVWPLVLLVLGVAILLDLTRGHRPAPATPADAGSEPLTGGTDTEPGPGRQTPAASAPGTADTGPGDEGRPEAPDGPDRPG
jgi:hypothetical protein